MCISERLKLWQESSFQMNCIVVVSSLLGKKKVDCGKEYFLSYNQCNAVLHSWIKKDKLWIVWMFAEFNHALIMLLKKKRT